MFWILFQEVFKTRGKNCFVLFRFILWKSIVNHFKNKYIEIKFFLRSTLALIPVWTRVLWLCISVLDDTLSRRSACKTTFYQQPSATTPAALHFSRLFCLYLRSNWEISGETQDNCGTHLTTFAANGETDGKWTTTQFPQETTEEKKVSHWASHHKCTHTQTQHKT